MGDFNRLKYLYKQKRERNRNNYNRRKIEVQKGNPNLIIIKK